MTRTPDGPSSFSIPPLAFRERTLENGLRVFAMPDGSTATVAVHVWYAVGSKDDPKDRSGFAHLFEHIMFKATRNMPAEFFDRLTEDAGGFNNASTYDDFTNYYEVAPANHLERLLWAEAERMGALVVDEAIFSAERDVVKEELRQRIFASPYGRLFGLYLAQTNFDVHPYGRPGIGSIEDLDGGDGRRRARVSRRLLSPRQRNPRGRRQFRRRRSGSLGGSVFRTSPSDRRGPYRGSTPSNRRGRRRWIWRRPRRTSRCPPSSCLGPASPRGIRISRRSPLWTRSCLGARSSRLYQSLVYEFANCGGSLQLLRTDD